MTDEDWSTGYARSLGVFLNGQELTELDGTGNRVVDDSFFLLFNASDQPLSFRLPDREWGRRWTSELDTAGAPDGTPSEAAFTAGGKVPLDGRSVVLLRKTA
jgi:isoamylase